MAEIDSLGTNYHYAGVQASSNEAIKRNQKKKKSLKLENLNLQIF